MIDGKDKEDMSEYSKIGGGSPPKDKDGSTTVVYPPGKDFKKSHWSQFEQNIVRPIFSKE